MQCESVQPVPGRRALLAVAAVGMTLHGILLTLGGPLLPSLMHEFALQEARAGMLLAAGSAGFSTTGLEGWVLLSCLMHPINTHSPGISMIIMTVTRIAFPLFPVIRMDGCTGTITGSHPHILINAASEFLQ